MSHPFTELGIPSDLVLGLEELKIFKPTPIQQKAITFLMESGADLIAQAQTGTGKTAAFGLPLLTKVDPKLKEIQGLVVAPTRELAKQIAKQLFRYTKHSTTIFVEVVCGGENIDRQAAALQRPTQIIVATPGRLLDMIRRGALSITTVKRLILDEADEMLSMGFKDDLTQILDMTKNRVSTWLFSATFPKALDELIEGCMPPDVQTLRVDQAHVVNRDIYHRFTVGARGEKAEFIKEYLKYQNEDRGLIFCRTKGDAIRLKEELATSGFAVDLLQGDMPPKDRDKVLRSFKKKRFQFLVATDVAARGIDIEGLTFVIHFTLPDQIDYYTHRSGRTARAGKKGTSIVLIEPKERWRIAKLEKTLDLHFDEIRI
jgi:ATP-dependent RNA helicase DeaD